MSEGHTVMIGKVEWDWRVDGVDGPVHVVMTLGDDLAFHSEQMPNYAESLTDRCREEYGGPASGPYGVQFLHDLARERGGTVVIEPKPDPGPDTVY